MANVNQPSGLAPVGYLNGAPYTGGGRLYCILAANTAAFFIGDPVTTLTSGDASLSGIPAVTVGVAGQATRGVIVGIGTNGSAPFAGGPYANPNNLGQLIRPSGAQATDYYVLVEDDPNVVFEIQDINSGTPVAAASISRNANYAMGTRTGAGPLSPATLNNASINTTNTLNLKILQVVQRPDNTPFALAQKLLVMINNHEFRAGTTSI